MRPTITTQHELEWQSSMVCKLGDHLLPYSFWVITTICLLVFLCSVLLIWAYDQHIRMKNVKRIQDVVRGIKR